MKKYIFLPNWYRQELIKKETGRLKVFLVMLAAVNALLFLLWIKNCSNMKNIEERKQNIIKTAAKAQKNIALSAVDLGALEAMNYFVADFTGFNISTAALEGGKINFEVTIPDRAGYYEIIKHIEDKKRYKIDSISKGEDKKGNLGLNISLEVVH